MDKSDGRAEGDVPLRLSCPEMGRTDRKRRPIETKERGKFLPLLRSGYSAHFGLRVLRRFSSHSSTTSDSVNSICLAKC